MHIMTHSEDFPNYGLEICILIHLQANPQIVLSCDFLIIRAT